MTTAQELDRMPRTEGTCFACGKDTLVYALGEFTCRKCALKPADPPALLVRESALQGGGIAWQALGPCCALWQIRWEPGSSPDSNIRAYRYSGGGGLYGHAATAEEARTEARRIAGLIASGKTREEPEHG